jgi:hypothetical protein
MWCWFVMAGVWLVLIFWRKSVKKRETAEERHGANAKDGIELHGLGAFAILHALRFEPGDLSVANYEGDGTGDALVFDVALDDRGDAFEAFGGRPTDSGFVAGRSWARVERTGKTARMKNKMARRRFMGWIFSFA